MRYAPEPPDVYLTISPEDGGVAGSEPPEDPGPVVPVREAVAALIEAAMPVKYKKEAAEKIGRKKDDSTFRDAWDDLERTGRIVEIDGIWISGGGALLLGNPTTTTDGFGSTPSSDPEGGVMADQLSLFPGEITLEDEQLDVDALFVPNAHRRCEHCRRRLHPIGTTGRLVCANAYCTGASR